MCPFCKKKKKNYTALKVVAIVFTTLAALAGAYVVFDKFLKDKLVKKFAKKNDEAVPDETEEAVEEVPAEEAPAETAEAE